jgi:HTH-type transcriptional regulator / antitoxin HipB
VIDDPDDPRPIFGAMIREARKRAGLSQLELAQRIQSTQAYVSRLERGLENPPIVTCALFAAAVDGRFDFKLVFT